MFPELDDELVLEIQGHVIAIHHFSHGIKGCVVLECAHGLDDVIHLGTGLEIRSAIVEKVSQDEGGCICLGAHVANALGEPEAQEIGRLGIEDGGQRRQGLGAK